jgi:hypothetical protein
MFTYPYQIIKLKLQTDVPELREIEWYANQDSTTDKDGLLLSSPGVYIQFTPTPIETFSGQKIQSGLAEFDAILLTDCVLDDDRRIRKTKPLDHMVVLDKVFKSLQNFSAKISYLPEFVSLKNTKDDQRSFNSLSRISITPPHVPRKAMMKSIQRFRALFYDHGAAKIYTTFAKPPLELTTEIDGTVLASTFDDTFDDSF